MIQYEIIGLRDALGRFASMADEGLREIQTVESESLAQKVADLYRARAPKRTGEFAASIHGESRPSGAGFHASITTDKDRIRSYLLHGTGTQGDGTHVGAGPGGAIVPLTTRALHFNVGGQEVFTRMVQGMHPNPWETEARAAVEPLVLEAGNKIGRRVVRGLSG